MADGHGTGAAACSRSTGRSRSCAASTPASRRWGSPRSPGRPACPRAPRTGCWRAMQTTAWCARPATAATASARCWSSWRAAARCRPRLRDAALPFMTALRDEVDETVGLHELLPSGERVVVDQVESRQELRRTYTDIGVPIPLAARRAGKGHPVRAAVARQEYVARPVRSTPVTAAHDHRSRPAARRAGRRPGAAAGPAPTSERTPGIRAVAAPIFDHTRRRHRRRGPLGARGADGRRPRRGARRRVEPSAWEVSEALGATRAAVEATVEAAGGR